MLRNSRERIWFPKMIIGLICCFFAFNLITTVNAAESGNLVALEIIENQTIEDQTTTSEEKEVPQVAIFNHAADSSLEHFMYILMVALVGAALLILFATILKKRKDYRRK